MQIKRTALSQLQYLSSHFPVTVVTGARQTGKTTLIKEFAAARGGLQYVTLDYPAIRNLARTDPELFLQQYRSPLILVNKIAICGNSGYYTLSADKNTTAI